MFSDLAVEQQRRGWQVDVLTSNRLWRDPHARLAVRGGLGRHPHPSRVPPPVGSGPRAPASRQQRLDDRGLAGGGPRARPRRRDRDRLRPRLLADGGAGAPAAPPARRAGPLVLRSLPRGDHRRGAATRGDRARPAGAAPHAAGLPRLRSAGRHRPADAGAAARLRRARGAGDAGAVGAQRSRAAGPGRRGGPGHAVPAGAAGAALRRDDGTRPRLRRLPAPGAGLPGRWPATRSGSASPPAGTGTTSWWPRSPPTTTTSRSPPSPTRRRCRRGSPPPTFTWSACATTGRAWWCRPSSSPRWRLAARSSTRARATPSSRAGSSGTTSGLTLKSDDETVGRVAARLVALAGDPEDLARWRSNALAVYRREWSKQVTNDRWNTLLRSLVAARSGRR